MNEKLCLNLKVDLNFWEKKYLINKKSILCSIANILFFVVFFIFFIKKGHRSWKEPTFSKSMLKFERWNWNKLT